MKKLIQYSLHDPYIVQTSAHLNPVFAGEWSMSRLGFYRDFKLYVRSILRKWDSVWLFLILLYMTIFFIVQKRI
jgi:hypothetical protein